jgi:DnaK suppressor protein
MAEIDIAAMRQKLVAERERLREELARVNGGLIDGTVGEVFAGRDSTAGDMGDDAVDVSASERDEAIALNLEQLLAQVDAAIQRVDNGTYGVCMRCGKPIAPRRLEALPYATLCIECESIVEREAQRP